jgi:putative ABC transport system substrate-binding protein
MRYRVVVAILLCGLALVATQSAWAQTKSVSVLGTERDAGADAMRDGLRDALKAVGFIEGRNLKMLSETVVDDEQRLSQQALNLVLARPDVLVALSVHKRDWRVRPADHGSQGSDDSTVRASGPAGRCGL